MSNPEDTAQGSDPLADVGTVVVVDRSTIRALRRGSSTEDAPEADPNAPQFDAPKGVENPTRYSVYDRVLGRYVGGQHDSTPSAKAVRELVGDHTHAIVGVR